MPIVNWSKEQEEIIKKLRANSEIFTKILEEDRDCLVINTNEREKLYNLIQRSKKLLEKIEGKKFTVAIVGLENSGKSTFGNALLKLNVLPHAMQRCTYTTTKICASSKDKGECDRGEIKFYTRDEFNKYFNALLKAIRYPKDLEDFTELDIVTFESFFNEQESQNLNISEDIKKIINGKNDIEPLLGKKDKIFEGAEKLGSIEFQKYITGFKEKDSHEEASAIPYAVKYINIYSTNLGDMEDIVLYDVPGFDSPTNLHKEQTLKMLEEADSIILVISFAETVQLRGTHLDMLKKGREEDGVSLLDKAFVFGNKLDMSKTKKEVQERTDFLRKNVIVTNKIVKENHFFVGSAQEYLYKNNVIKSEDGSEIDLSLKNMGFSDGIDELRKAMFEYYNSDRFDILAKRANNILNDAKLYLDSVCQNFSNSYSEAIDTNYMLSMGLKLSNKSNLFYEHSNEITEEYLKEISNPEKLPFSSIIKKDIEDIYPHEDENSERLKKAKLNTSLDSDNVYSEIKIDVNLRENLYIDFIKEIVKRTDKQIYEEENKIYEKLAEEFLNIMEVSKKSPYYDEMKKSVLNIFWDILKNQGEKCRFNTLVERFNTSLIETVIKTPFASDERLNKIKGKYTLPEFFSLSAYYAMNDDYEDIGIDNENLRMRIFSQILAHNDILQSNEKEIENSFSKFFANDDIKELLSEGASLVLDFVTIKKLAKIVTKSGIAFDKLIRPLKNAFNNDSWSKKEANDKADTIVKTVEDTCNEDRKVVYKGGLLPSLDLFHKQAMKKKEELYKKANDECSKEKDKNKIIEHNMLNIINEDIDILRDITVNSVLKAIGLERAFCATIKNNVELIRNAIKTNEEDRLNNWIQDNIAKIKEDEFKKIESEIKKYETKKKVFDYINELRSKLNKEEINENIK